MLLTSNGVLDGLAREALIGLLDKPISECRTVVLVDAMLPFPGDKTDMLQHIDRYRALGWAECDILTLFSESRTGIEARLRSAPRSRCLTGTSWHTSGRPSFPTPLMSGQPR